VRKKRYSLLLSFLPLALDLAAAQIADHNITWDELIADFETEIVPLKSLEFPGVDEISDEVLKKRFSLIASFRLSLRRLPADLQLAFAWFGVLPEDVKINNQMGATLWGTDERTARDHLRYLHDKALISYAGNQQNAIPVYKLHDLLHDFSHNLLTKQPADGMPGLSLPLNEAHAMFLERYKQTTRNNMWHTLTDDGYIYQYLVWHMAQAKQEESIHELLCEENNDGQSGWFEALARSGLMSQYLNDLSVAWDLSQRNRDIGRQLHYSLCYSSVSTLHINTPGVLLARLVEFGWLSPEEAFSHALSNEINVGQLNNTLLDLIPAFAHTHPLLVKRTLQIIENTPKIFKTLTAESLSRIVDYLPPREQIRVANNIIDFIKHISFRDNFSMVAIETRLIKYLDRYEQRKLRQRVFLWLEKNKLEEEKIGVCCYLMDHLKGREREALYNKSLQMIAHLRELEDHRESAIIRAMSYLYPYANENQRFEFTDELFLLLAEYQSEIYFWDIIHLLECVPYLNDSQANQLVDKFIQPSFKKSNEHIPRFLGSILPSQFERFLKITEGWLFDTINEISPLYLQAEALAIIIPHVSEGQKISLLKKAHRLCRKIGAIDSKYLQISMLPYLLSVQNVAVADFQSSPFSIEHVATLVRNFPFLDEEHQANIQKKFQTLDADSGETIH
jgi:hypothetical protein